jgi:ABC-type Fe3+/spermidine/putrescine transport system ATPase subunit
LLSILGLLDSPTGGQYLLNGQEVSRLGNKELAAIRNREIGFIFQSFNLIGDLSVFENVELPLTYRGVRPIERIEWVNTALEKVGMTPRGRHYPSQLSGGQQQRVAVARALAGNPTHELLPLLMVRAAGREHEVTAIRDLIRARYAAMDDQRKARNRLKGFLLRLGFRYTGKSIWNCSPP